MFNQTIIGIIAISVVIPLSSIAIWDSAHSVELIDAPSINQKIIVLASFYPLYDFTKEVGKDKVEVSLIVPFGVEPHEWDPTIHDLQMIQQADLIVINGIGFEDWVKDVEYVNSDVTLVDTSTDISIFKDTENLIEENHDSFADPHIWLNPVLAKTQVKNIENALIEFDQTNEKYFSQNANSYIKKLDLLDNKISNELSSCKKDFIAFHNAFSYFAIQYGLNQHTILSSTDPHAEPTAKTLENIINLAKKLETNVIFTEEALDTRSAQVIANEIGGKVLTLSPIEIGQTDTSYLEKMEQNLSNLKEALCN